MAIESEVMLTVTDRAKRQLLDLNIGGGRFLRVDVQSGGCSGMTYTACIDTEKRSDDRVIYEEGDIVIVSSPQSCFFLNGLRIDYSDDLIKSGFQFTNPNANKSCGCGASFAV